MDGTTKTSKDFAKIAGKKIVHKSAEATGDLVRNKLMDLCLIIIEISRVNV